MNYASITSMCAFALLVSILVLMDLGRRVGVRRLKLHGGDAITGVGAIDGAVFALLGLLLAFTFSGAASRFDVRRQLIVEEANNIGTAYLRIDLVPANAQPELRDKFRAYVEARLNAYRNPSDPAATRKGLAEAVGLQNQIWAYAVTACHSSDTPAATMLLLPALNQMIDITTTRTVAAATHPPALVFGMLLILVLASSFLAGHCMAGTKCRDWVHMVCFAFVMTTAVYLILDLEFPRMGLIRVDSFDRVLVEVRQSMN